jgi:hypothetical protein
MSVKIRQRFLITDGIGVVEREREREREREKEIEESR